MSNGFRTDILGLLGVFRVFWGFLGGGGVVGGVWEFQCKSSRSIRGMVGGRREQDSLFDKSFGFVADAGL